MPGRSPGGRLVALLIVGGIFLGWVLQWFLGNLLYNGLWTVLGKSFGLREADLISYILGNFIPFALAAGIVAAIYSAMRYEMNKTGGRSQEIAAPTAATPSSVARQPDRKSIPISLTIGLAALVLVFVLYIALSLIPYKLSDRNANVQVTGTQIMNPGADDARWRVDIRVKNTGPTEATDLIHANNRLDITNTIQDDSQIDERFRAIRESLISSVKRGGGGMLDSGEEARFTYVLNPEDLGRDIFDAVVSRRVIVYIYWAQAYKDSLIPNGKLIISEKCWYTLPTGAVARCNKHQSRMLVDVK